MDGNGKDLLNTFSQMMNAVKSRENYHNVEVPIALYTEPEPAKKEAPAGRPALPRRQGSQRASNPPAQEIWEPLKRGNIHPKVQEKLGFIQSVWPRPSVADICKPCRLSARDFPERQDRCNKSALTNWCHAQCTRDHTVITNDEADALLLKLKTIVDNPRLVKARVRDRHEQ